MTLGKNCGMCKTEKPLGDFFLSPFDGSARQYKSSTYCKQCHDEGKVEHGYGWPGFGGKFNTPEEATA